MTTSKENDKEEQVAELNERMVRPSIAVKMIRHAESMNNQVYRNARFIYRGGTPEFDEAGWNAYVNEHRRADPSLSSTGRQQAEALAEYLVPHLTNQAHYPVNILVSPMKRTCETIQSTVAGLLKNQQTQQSDTSNGNSNGTSEICHVTVQGFYFESEGCHTNEVPEEGMNPSEIKSVLYPETDTDGGMTAPTDFVGFPDTSKGWWCDGTGPETRAQSEQRAAKFYLWLCEYLDQQLLCPEIYDAGVSIPGEEKESEHNKTALTLRRRHTQLLIGHGDFMSLVLKRIMAGFGHSVEVTGIPHRSAFVHWNTGITELEYFGNGRFLLMGHNSTPHLPSPDLLSGGSLKDGWSYLLPHEAVFLNAEVSVAFEDEELEDHVLEQRDALKALYLSSKESEKLCTAFNGDNRKDIDLLVEEEETREDKKERVKHFVVKRGLQVVGVATFSETTGVLSDVAVRPSAGKEGTEALFTAVKAYSKKLGRSGSLRVQPRSTESKLLFEAVGFTEEDDKESEHMELKH